MQLIGMLDSPYVRRVAISLRMMGVPFEHRSLSVFRDYDAFAAINPAVKAPTLVTDAGIVLMDSTLILEHAELSVPAALRLHPAGEADRVRSQRLIGLALVACEKTVQIVYERRLRPAEKQHEPWVERVTTQLRATCEALEKEANRLAGNWFFGSRPLQADVSLAVAWSFSRLMLRDLVRAEDFPRIADHAAKAEALAEFLACPID